MSTPPLNITIIGAGIAGLTAALALAQHGHHITILEKSHFKQETGAAMSLSPNVSGHMQRLGISNERVGANLCEGFVSVTGETGEVRAAMDLTEVAKQWKNPWLFVHRVDCHNELLRLARGKENVVVELGVKIISLDVETGNVALDDGKKFESDAIIGADGNNSFARQFVDEKVQLKEFGKSCYRFLVDRSTLAEDPETQEMVAFKENGYFGDICGADRKFVIYPCRDNKVMNFVCFLNEEFEGTGDDWDQQGNKAKLMKGFEGFYGQARKMMAHADEDLKVWQLVDMDQLGHWNKGKLALIGDAAHPFLPFLAQGAAQAIEDAVSVATVLGSGAKKADVPELLKLYDETRRERVNFVQAETVIGGRDEDKGRPPPSRLFELLDYCHKHDEWENTEQKLEEWKQQRAGANGAKA